MFQIIVIKSSYKTIKNRVEERKNEEVLRYRGNYIYNIACRRG